MRQAERSVYRMSVTDRYKPVAVCNDGAERGQQEVEVPALAGRQGGRIEGHRGGLSNGTDVAAVVCA
jgi:hypothetical protein